MSDDPVLKDFKPEAEHPSCREPAFLQREIMKSILLKMGSIAFFGCLFCQIGQGLTPVAYGRSLAEIKTTREIRICLAGSSQDFYKKNAMAFVEYLGEGIQAKYTRFGKWSDQFLNPDGIVVKDGEYTPEPLASGQCDLYPNDLVRLDWREKKLAYVLLYFSRNTIIVNKARADEFKDIQDLAGKTVAVMEGTSYHTWLEKQNLGVFAQNPIKFNFMPQEQAIKAVDSGKADFAMAGADGALWAINNFAKNCRVAFPVGKSTEYGWCLRKEDRDLQKAVKAFFDVQRNSLDSAINRNWKEGVGLTLGEFILFVTSTTGATEN